MKRSPFWYCEECGAQNHEDDGECRFCEKHECYVSGEDWVAAGQPDDPDTLPCSRCGQSLRPKAIIKQETK